MWRGRENLSSERFSLPLHAAPFLSKDFRPYRIPHRRWGAAESCPARCGKEKGSDGPFVSPVPDYEKGMFKKAVAGGVGNPFPQMFQQGLAKHALPTLHKATGWLRVSQPEPETACKTVDEVPFGASTAFGGKPFPLPTLRGLRETKLFEHDGQPPQFGRLDPGLHGRAVFQHPVAPRVGQALGPQPVGHGGT